MNSLKDLNDYSDTGVFYEDQNQPIITTTRNGEEITAFSQDYLTNRYQINGLVDTNKNVMSNLGNIANSAGSWISYDILDGKWSVVINQAGTSEYSFSDDNIIGSIKLNGSGLDKLYNAVEVQFPHTDLQDQADYTRIDMFPQDMLPNEQDHTLKITYPLVTNPVQAELLGFIEFKQARVDQIVTFRVDYSYTGISAGTVIDISSDVYNWDKKEFRVIKLAEVDDDSGINIEITALEYDASVYDESNLIKYQRSNADGIIQIGALGKPGTPQVYKFEVDVRPGVYIESRVPDNTDPTNGTGLVEGMEFWLYFLSPEEIPNWELIDDETRQYTLAAVVAPPSGQVFEPGYLAYLDIDNISDANVLVKTRAVNGTTTGPYSEMSGLVEYIPYQMTDAISNETEVLDDDWNSILGQIGLAGLMALLNGLLEHRDTQPGSMYDTTFDLFSQDDNSSSYLVKPLLDSGVSSIVFATKMASGILSPTDIPSWEQKEIPVASNVVLPYTGSYKIRYFVNWGGSGDPGIDGIYKTSAILIPGKDPGQWANTGDSHVRLYEDHHVEGFIEGVKGEVIDLNFGYRTEWMSAQVWIIAEVYHIPPGIYV